MPVLETSAYRSPRWLRNGHLQTVASSFRRVPAVAYGRERIGTPDGDFLDLDWSRDGGRPPGAPLVIISYGMESESSSPYVRAAVLAFRARGLDAVVWNYRGCSGVPNRKPHFYHGALTADLDAVVRHALSRGYADLRLAGYSLGGNLLLNYLGRRAADLDPAVRRAAAFSAPVDFAGSSLALRRPVNRLYARLFLASFRRKIRAKMAALPGQIDDCAFRSIATLEDYDRHYTAPHFGFASVADYYRAASSRHVLGAIRIPTLVVSALDDPFMGPRCIPFEEARAHPSVTLETPRHGGHLGFLLAGGGSWMERRAVEFLAG